ncbi:MAG TPA: prepilin-type N-terminal cleavage/methylation domain-containing protein [Candidatus Sumerlaeota bacterium]|nr:prepilin-type N-terminal cleavage/methylation domain-containing protein [Candidatus Sumerlaeota bacterium]HOR28843.1 prepilin-type N-terminal cleavage/methylation domain-containing protein [Candidatus Sumerlaeota bacterium]HPK02474.1 prepilin-type N-terminal cleavage/methylation domain-containing protein [Candidatus Sumerlaeota bacterium]
MRKAARRGFTLVELIIVIVILGILGTIAIPQLISSTKDAEEATLAADLTMLRNSISLYYHQHNSVYPGVVTSDGAGTATDATNNVAAFISQLREYSDKSGRTSAVLDRANFPFGPYLNNGLPENPINGLATVKMLTDSDAIASGEIDGTTGWLYNSTTGEIRSNTTGYLEY